MASMLIFFKQAREVIKFDIYEVVLDYFNRGIMYFPLNITTVTLIPKIENASSVTDYMPISCCSVIYKIISKILTARLHKVVCYLVNMAQSGFILGRQIVDNVLIASDLIEGYNWAHISLSCMVKVDMAKAYDSDEFFFLKHVLYENRLSMAGRIQLVQSAIQGMHTY